MQIAKDRKDISQFDLLVSLAINVMAEFSPSDLPEKDRYMIDGLVISIGFLLAELPDNLDDPLTLDFGKFYNSGMDYLRLQVIEAHLNSN